MMWTMNYNPQKYKCSKCGSESNKVVTKTTQFSSNKYRECIACGHKDILSESNMYQSTDANKEFKDYVHNPNKPIEF